MKLVLFGILVFSLLFVGCFGSEEQLHELTEEDRLEKIPNDAVKVTPEMDKYPPVLHSDEFEEPIPFDAVNSAGAEDSPFIPSDRDEFYFFFTPDVDVPVEKQVLDGVTGVWISKYENGIWQEPKRVILQDSGKLSLDGCEFVHGDMILFCTAREGYTGLHWSSAERDGDSWKNWRVDDFPEEYDVGELHIVGDTLYYHSDKDGGMGGYDIWFSKKVNGKWQEPENIEIINTEETDGWPFVTPDGNELWFTRTHLGSPAIFKSEKVEGKWQEPELIISQFAGEPTLDKAGNLYFVHHYYDDGKMLEADIYVAYKK
ncbi:MAG: hypothetical protein ABH983_02695 [Candidatus Micrarchaeota archaeon]|nr:hypothetical protein [Candidatus Micrarchaeota archaeon]MBU1681558.1 hypothetical protein [Candidatus Micrarchaeota archaeon]